MLVTSAIPNSGKMRGVTCQQESKLTGLRRQTKSSKSQPQTTSDAGAGNRQDQGVVLAPLMAPTGIIGCTPSCSPTGNRSALSWCGSCGNGAPSPASHGHGAPPPRQRTGHRTRPGGPGLHHRGAGTRTVGDISYIPTWVSWLYLATVIDRFNNEVIGSAMADKMRTSLVADALDMAARIHTQL
jgi:transposase InsO family protein